MDDLKHKISQVKDEHAIAAVEKQGSDFAEKARLEAAFLLGRIKQTGHIAVAVANNLSAQEIRALEAFQAQHMYRALGYDTFMDFLAKDPMAPMTKHQYYERLALANAHGDEVYDLLTSLGISVRSAKLLGAGELSIKGDKLMIGDEEIGTGDSPLIKQAIQELCDDRRKLQDELKAAAKKVDDQKDQIAAGVAEIEQLERNIDAMRARNPYDTAFMSAINELLELAEMIGTLPDEQKAKRGSDGLPVLNTALQRVRAAYGTNFNFTAETAAPDNVLDEIAAQVNAIDDEELD